MSKAVDDETFLEADAEIPGQKFCLLSFLSPEKVLADKNIFMFDKFLQSYEFASRTKNLEAFLMKTVNSINSKLDVEADRLMLQDLSGASDICRQSKIRVDTLMDDFHKFVKGNERELRETGLKERYDDFMYANKDKMEDEFFAKNNFTTTVRGLKIRGTFGSQGEAVARSKKLQRLDPLHNIYVAEVGKWLPWDPSPSDVKDQEYAEDQLNTLMKKYQENEEQREQFHREQRERAKAGSKKATHGIDAAAPVEGATAPTEERSISDMFGSSGPADLAIARKLERESAAAAKKDE